MRRTLLQWTLVGTVMGAVTGVTSAVFLALLEQATRLRESTTWLPFALPAAGFLMGWALELAGRPIEAGSNLIIDSIHDDGPQVPTRMAPMVLIGTVWTHLVGGSAGREGTAVQMGASLADALAHRFPPLRGLRRPLLAAGVAGGFGAVFGTPLAGAVFGLEFVALGQMETVALWPALVAALVGDRVTRGLGIAHASYPTVAPTPLTPTLMLRWLVFAVAVAAACWAFVEGTHAVKKVGKRLLPRPRWRLAAGGTLVLALTLLFDTRAYLGLGVAGILRAFVDPTLGPLAWAAKGLFTAVTLGSGFMGGEVTPLFFVGASLGNALAAPLDLPLALAAGVGMAALFGAAANTPLALTIMAAELLGAAALPHAALVCVLSYLLSGHRGIYPGQRVAHDKHGLPRAGLALRDWPSGH